MGANGANGFQPLTSITSSSSSSSLDGFPTKPILVERLRLEALSVLSAALSNETFRQDKEKMKDMRIRAIRVFFKALFTKSTDLVEVLYLNFFF